MMNKNNIKIAIDGPSGAGKSTLAKNIAKKMNYMYLDTGALYRTVGLYIYNKKIDSKDTVNIINSLPEIKVDVEFDNGKQLMYLNGTDVTTDIRQNDISTYASDVSAIPQVRTHLLGIQRETADKYDIVMDGRDIGTVIMPDAQVKIFLSADVNERAERRYQELIAKGDNVDFQKILNDIIKRDENDSSRDTAPMKPADDAVPVNNSGFSEEETLDFVLKIIKEKFGI
jgi:cytidylate kinase